nr:hypothetical protein [Edwardsiella hoshinae]
MKIIINSNAHKQPIRVPDDAQPTTIADGAGEGLPTRGEGGAGNAGPSWDQCTAANL